MSLLRDFRAERLIVRLLATWDHEDRAEERNELLARLRSLGGAGINKLIQSLGRAGREEAERSSDLLVRLLGYQTLPYFIDALADPNPLVVGRVSRILAGSTTFDPNRLVDALTRPGVSRAALLDVVGVHRKRLNAAVLLRQAAVLEGSERNALYRLVAEVANDSVLPELLSRLSGKDPGVRQQIVRILARFDRPDVVAALKGRLQDADRLVRQAALEALSSRLTARELCELLRDRDMRVQELAIDALVRLNDPDTVTCLCPLLQDEADSVRRAAVEVLNGIGTPDALKQLLVSVKDADWWVRVRSADALARIGGPRVVKAVVDLIRDEDEFVRRSAIEILNSTRDERSLSYLIDALEDADWWVRERAVDALATLGNKAAVPALLRMLKRDEQAAIVVLRALAKLGDERVIRGVLEQLRRPEKLVQLEALQTLGELADSENAGQIGKAAVHFAQNAIPEVREAAQDLRDRLLARYEPGVPLDRSRVERGQADETVALSMLQYSDDTAAGRAAAAGPLVAPALDVAALASGDMIGERYRFVRRVGRGAFGTVLLVEDVDIAETLILKVLHPQMAADQDMIRRFVQEMRLSRKITHENVIRIYDFLKIQGLLAISMEYFPSSPLAASLQGGQPLPLERALSYARDIASGMAAAHETGVVHRDLKAGNVLVNSRGMVKIVDFGVAAARASGDQHLTRTGVLIGTPRYMAPEQVLGKPVDARADIYALGVLMYEMLSGTLPYVAEDQMAVMYQHVQGKARPVHELNPDVPRTLSTVVAKMMAVSPEDRYQSMDEVRRVLAGFVG